MPHTNRKKKSSTGAAQKPKIVHTKRQLLDDEEGWTHVVDSKKPVKQIEVKELGLKPWEGDFVSGGTAVVHMTYEELEFEYARSKQQWEGSEACTSLKTILAEKKDSLKISNVVCIGLGSLQDWKLQGRRTSQTQLAALETIIKCLGLESVRKITQEPLATDLDAKFMSSLQYDSCQSPEGYKQINEGSLVFAVHCYPDVYQAISQQASPSMLIVNDVEAWLENAKITNASNQEMVPDLEKLIEGCTSVPFPHLRFDFSDTKIYTRSTTEQS